MPGMYTSAVNHSNPHKHEPTLHLLCATSNLTELSSNLRCTKVEG